MSDPGTSYRTRDEVQKQRQQRDPIKTLSDLLVSLKWLPDEAAVKEMDREARVGVERQVEQAVADQAPDEGQLWSDVYVGGGPVLRRGCLDYE
jgi:pyruvate dehydrogenase E1 component alpha subunit